MAPQPVETALLTIFARIEKMYPGTRPLLRVEDGQLLLQFWIDGRSQRFYLEAGDLADERQFAAQLQGLVR